MVLFIILLLITFLLVVATIAVIAVGGVVGIVLFSDVIVCIAILVFIIKKLTKKK